MPRDKKKHQFQHTKHQHVDDVEGWTHVVRGPAARKMPQNQNKTFSPPALKSIEELRASYDDEKAKLQESKEIRALRRHLTECLDRHDHIVLTHVVCIGLGNLAHRTTYNSMKQLVFLEEAIDVLRQGKRLAQPEHVYFQDQFFEPLDMQFLLSLGYHPIPYPWAGSMNALKAERNDGAKHESLRWTPPIGDLVVLEAPRLGMTKFSSCPSPLGCAAYLSEHTFLFAPFVEADAIRAAVAFQPPALFIGSDYKSHYDFFVGKRDADMDAWFAETEWLSPPEFRDTDQLYCHNLALVFRHGEAINRDTEKRWGLSGDSPTRQVPRWKLDRAKD